MLHGILHLLQAEKEKEMINKKTWHTPVQLLISAAGILILSWIDLNAVAIHYNETINEFVAEYDTTGFAILNVVLCLFTSYFLARLLSWSKSTWSLMFVIYTLMLCAFVPKLIAITSAVYLSLHFMSSARLFGSVLAVRTVIIVIAFILLIAGIVMRCRDRHSPVTMTLLSLSTIISCIMYEFSTFAYAWYFYLGLLGMLPIFWLAMRQNHLKIPRDK